MPHKLSLDQFLLSLKLSPRLVVELIIQDSSDRLLLLRRLTPPYIDTWHLPGGFLLKGELINDCVNRLLFEEVRCPPVPYKYLSLFENIDGDPRGHLLHYIVGLKIDKKFDSDDFQYFSSIPQNTMHFQVDMLKKIGFASAT